MAITALGLLIEPAATNLVVQSQDTTQAQWTKSGCSTGTAILAPDNSQTAIPITVTATPFPSLRETFSVTSGTPYSFSGFVKLISGDPLIDFELNDTAAGQGTIYFNSSTGAISLINQTNWTMQSATVTQIVNNWFWVRCTFTPSFTSTNTWLNIYQSSVALAAGTTTGAASTVGSKFAPWGMQLVAESVPSSYFPTTTVSAGRSADVVTLTLANATYDILVEDTAGAVFNSGVVVGGGSYTLSPRAGQLHVTRVRVWPSTGVGSLTAAQKAAIAPG